MDNSPRLNILHVVLLIVLIGAAVAWPMFVGSPASPRTHCISNLKQLGVSMQIYIGDYDDRFPPKTWHDELMPYAKIEDLFTCIEISKKKRKWGYAMNYDILGQASAKLGYPEITPMLFEIDALAQDVVANVAARSTTRHKGRDGVTGSSICRLDGSARFFAAGQPLNSTERY